MPRGRRDTGPFKAVLLKARNQLLGSSSSIEKNQLAGRRTDSAGDLSAMPIHFADIGSDTFEQEFSLDLLSNAQEMLAEINDALDRIVEGSYGDCEECGKKIRMTRLRALPYARFCIDCQTKIEERQQY